ncbi:MAG: hypothetical protein K6C99_10400 [Lachnospiraceae bacterium]|nr:hypothetical protein [Lachnospiraceae bacterium]
MSEIEDRQGSTGENGTQNPGFSWDTQASEVQTQPGIQPVIQPQFQSGMEPQDRSGFQQGMQSQIPPQGQFIPGGQGPQPVPADPSGNKKRSLAPLLIALSVGAVFVVGVIVAVFVAVFGDKLKGGFGGVKEQSLELSDTSVVTLTEGEDYTLTIENFDELDKGQNIKWESADDHVITVKDKGNGKAKITAVAEGKSSVFITGENLDKKKGYVVKFDVQKENFEYAGKAWKTSSAVYYFPEADSMCEFSDDLDLYISGAVNVTEVEKEYATWEITDYVDSGRYFRFDFNPKREVQYGKDNGISTGREIWFGYNKKGDTYIYDDFLGYPEEAEEIDIKDYDSSLSDADSIEAFLDGKSGGGINYTNGRMNLYGSEFDTNDAFHDNTRLIQCGDMVYVRCDDGVYSLPESSLGTGSGNLTKINLSDDNVNFFATDGKKMAYAAGDDKGDVDLYVYDPSSGKDTLLLSDISCMHMAFCDDKVYYTESWDSLKYVDMSGNVQTIWQNTVGAFYADWNFVYIYDGTGWTMLDIGAGYISNGYLCKGRSYECDRIYALEDNIITVTYDYNNSSISLHGLDFAGAEGNLSGEYYGDTSDTYALACCGIYGYFFAYEGESVVCVDITTGSSADIDLSSYGLWYGNEMSVAGDRVILHVYDAYGDDGYVEVDRSLNITGLPELPHTIDPNGGSAAAYLF